MFQDSERVKEAASVLECLLRVNSSIGFIVFSFGHAYAKLALFLYGGSTLVTGIGPVLLQCHCLAILFLAINGITECYAAATMNVAELNKFAYNYVFLLKLNTYTLMFTLFFCLNFQIQCGNGCIICDVFIYIFVIFYNFGRNWFYFGKLL